MDLISVVVPIYNVEKYLDRCIKSIEKQTYKNIEIMLVNDESPDNSDVIMKDHEKKDKRIRCFYKKNGGLSDARNYAIKRAKGKYICFIDSDDYIEPTYVSKLYNSIIENDSQIAWCDFRTVSDDKAIGEITQNYEDLWSFEMPSACNKLFLLDLFTKNNIEFPKGIWYEDLATTPRLILTAKKISWVNEKLYNYYYNPDSITKTYSKKALDMKKVLEIDYDFALKHKLLEDKKIYEVLEYIFLYSGLLSTAFRISASKDVKMKDFKSMVLWIEDKFPNIYNNKIAKERLDFKRKVLKTLIRFRMFYTMKLIVKIFRRRR